MFINIFKLHRLKENVTRFLSVNNYYNNYFRSLQAPSNRIMNITAPDKSLIGLTELNLSNNPIQEWSDVIQLSKVLPNLTSLSLNECLISKIKFPNNGIANWFPSLSMLQLSSCKIDNWESIEALNAITSLVHFKFKNNPILEKENKDTCRQLIIAAIGSIKYLNGSIVEKQERRGAEIDFLKKYGKEYLSLQSSDASIEMENFVATHPRYNLWLRFKIEFTNSLYNFNSTIVLY